MKTPLKIILRNFLNHVEDLDARRRANDDQYEVEFQRLKQLTDRLKEDAQYSCSHGHKEVNRPKNRYKDIVPYDFCRVTLPEFSEIPGSDYINASYIKGASGACAYIAAQGPLPNTVLDFWRMIWACDIKVIIMACNQQEAGKFKCESYWPEENEPKQYGTISVQLVKTSQVCVDFLVRTLSVKQEEEEKLIYQFHYTTWPDHGVPVTVYPILELVRLVRDCQASETVPLVIHCSAGCGRTGTICAIDFVWACLRSGKLNESFCLYDIVSEMRQQRIAMVQTKEQYVLIHKAVAAMFEQQLSVIDCHIYVNLDEDGEPLLWKGLRDEKGENNVNGSNTQAENVPSYGAEGVPPSKDDQSSSRERDITENMTLESCPKKSSLSNEESCKRLSKPEIINAPANSTMVKSCEADSVNAPPNKREELNVLYLPHAVENNEQVTDNNLNSPEADDTIPFIDEDDEDVKIRPQGGRAYLNLPSCESITKIINCFDPFVDKISVGTDESSPEMESCANGSALYVPPQLKPPIPQDFKLDSVSLSCKSEVIPHSLSSTATMKSAPTLPKASHPRTSSNAPKCQRLAYSADAADHELVLDKIKTKSQRVHGETPKAASVDENLLFKSASTKLQTDMENKLNKTVTFRNKAQETTEVESKTDSTGGDSVPRQTGKASVLRRPSIARIKALFDKSGTDSNQRGGEKRSLFRHHSHPISRAGSAPPSLDCVSRSSDIEKQSLLEMVTRKFRSSSVKSEREFQKDKKPIVNHTSSSKKSGSSSFSHFKENISNLTRNVSFSFSKCSAKTTQSLPQTKWHDKPNIEPSHLVTFDKTHEKISLGEEPSSDSKKHTHWYDSVVTKNTTKTYVKTISETNFSKHSTVNDIKAPSKTDTSLQTNQGTQPISVNVTKPLITSSTDKKPKVPLFYASNKVVPREASTMWYKPEDQASAPTVLQEIQTPISSETPTEVQTVTKNTPVSTSPTSVVSDTTKTDRGSKESNKFEVPKSPESESKVQLSKSRFYAQLNSNVDRPPVLPIKKRLGITSLNLISDDVKPNSESAVCGNSKFFWPSNSFAPSHDQNLKLNSSNVVEGDEDKVSSDKEKSSESVNAKEPAKCKPEVVSSVHPLYARNMLSEEETEKKTDGVPPALPKKMLVGKNKNIEFLSLVDADDGKSGTPAEHSPKGTSPEVSPCAQYDKNEKLEENKDSTSPPPVASSSDVYINVNAVAKKNIERIENTLRNHPRGAIIDLTSRQSYSMEEELAMAVKQLSEPIKKAAGPYRTAMDAKLAGYEIIWPESKYVKSTSGMKNEGSSRPSVSSPFNQNNLSRSLQPGELLESLNRGKKSSRTGPCYSPPLRRNVDSSFLLSKSQSCVTLDWQELEKTDIPRESNVSISENKSTETLVSEAVVELTTLLDELTTRTLSEDVDMKARSGQTEIPHVIKSSDSDEKNSKTVDKSKSGQSSAPDFNVKVESFAVAIKPLSTSGNIKDEEIVFHFPPPPPIPPPPQDEPVQEFFDVRCEKGVLCISETSKGNNDVREKSSAEAYIQTDVSRKSFLDSIQVQPSAPMPLPRKTKQSTITDSDNQNKSTSCSLVDESENPSHRSESGQTLQNLKRGELVRIPNQKETQPVVERETPQDSYSSDHLERNRLSSSSDDTLPKNSTEEHQSDSQNTSVQTSHEQKLEHVKCAVGKETSVVLGNAPRISHSATPRYENISLIKPEMHSKRESSSEEKDSSRSSESLNLSADDVAPKKFITYPQRGRSIQQVCDVSPIYGKIKKVPPSRICAVAPLQLKEGTVSFPHDGDQCGNNTDEKKKPLPSRKSERAPLPPTARPRMTQNNEKSSSLKRIPSRKLERAPPPPGLNTSASCTSLAPGGKLEIYDAQNPPSHHPKHKLHALYENISEMHSIAPCRKVVDDSEKPKDNSESSPQVNYGLKHSHSDASVFLALREGKVKHPHPKQKPPVEERSKEVQKDGRKGSVGTSGSSSDDSEGSLKLVLGSHVQDVSEHQKSASHRLKKDFPVAPPRSKRRSTMEIHYVKSSETTKTSEGLKHNSLHELPVHDHTQSSGVIAEDKPPEIPVKTKDAFEVPEEFRHKACTLPNQKDVVLSKNCDDSLKQVENKEKITDTKPPVILRKELVLQEYPPTGPVVKKSDFKRRTLPAVSSVGLPRCPEKNMAPRKPLQ